LLTASSLSRQTFRAEPIRESSGAQPHDRPALSITYFYFRSGTTVKEKNEQ